MLLGFWGGAQKNGSHGGKFPGFGQHYLQPTPLFSAKRRGGGVHTYTEVPNEVPVDGGLQREKIARAAVARYFAQPLKNISHVSPQEAPS